MFFFVFCFTYLLVMMGTRETHECVMCLEINSSNHPSQESWWSFKEAMIPQLHLQFEGNIDLMHKSSV